MNLMGKVAVVTGATGGIGRAVAIEMASQGAAVVLSDVRAESLECTVRELLEGGLTVIGSVADITTPAGNQQLVTHALEKFGRIDVFHANAGVAPFEDLLQATA
jgi:NAD(P)-dependent dehydrogenase (short-subunit alcohol dehydrogenase family)